MNNSEINQQQIEAYLLNQLSESEKATFQTKLLFDKKLQEEVKRMRQIQKGAVIEKQVASSKGTKTAFWKWLVPLLVIGLIGTYFSSQKETTNPSNEQLDKTTDIFLPIEAPKAEQLPAVETESKNEEKTVTPTKQPKKKPNSIKKEVPVASERIRYASNYTVNPVLEAALTANLRGDYDFTIKTPKTAQTFELKNNKITWNLTGELITDNLPEEDFSLILEVYVNKKDVYENGETFLQVPITLEKIEETKYRFTSSHQLEVARRLYYYLLRDDFSGATFTGGKFLVQ